MKIGKKSFLFFCLAVLFTAAGYSQTAKDSALFAPMLRFSYLPQFPGGDFADRFGFSNNIGLDFAIKTKKNWIFGLSGNFIFSDKVRESNMLDSFATSAGHIIDKNGAPAEIQFGLRGFCITAQIGKILPWFKPNKNSGFIIMGGIGLLQHKVFIKSNNDQTPILYKENLKGFDRLTNGLCITEFIGYHYLGKTRIVNFYAGIELIQGFTKNRRSYNYDQMRKDDTQRLDLLSGLRFGWILPLYKRLPKEFYYY